MKRILPCVSLAAVCLVRPAAPAMAQDAPKQRPPVIDMHLHAVPAVGWPGDHPSLARVRISRPMIPVQSGVPAICGRPAPIHFTR